MASTVEHVRRQLRARCPLAPPLFADSLIQQAYNKLCDRRGWSFLRSQGTLTVAASRSGTANVTQGIALVTGVGITFVAGDAGRQLRVGSSFPQTIASVDTGANTATLDEPFLGTTTTPATVTILDAFVTLPENFGHFIAVLDPPNSRQLRTGITDDELNYYDPQRSFTGNAGALVSRRLSTYAATTGQPQYELVPYQTTAQRFPYFCFNRPGELAADDTFQGPLRHRTDVIMTGALAELALWPGLPEKRNPYYSLELADRLTKQFIVEVGLLEVQDENLYMTWLETVGLDKIPYASYPLAPADYRNSDWAPEPWL